MHSNLSHIGKLHSIKICSRDAPRPPLSYLKISGGIFHDCIVHDMDMLRYLTGENPSTVYTLAHCHDPEIAELKDVDTVFVVLQFPSGVIAHIDISRECVYGYHQTVQVYGDKGSMMSDNPRQSGLMLNGGQRSDDIFFSFHDRYAVAYSLELEHFFKLIRGEEKECDIKAKDTLQATVLSQAAEDSFKNGCVINYSEYTKHKFSNIGI
ncbi:unnamed protein product [Clavelina lepadiformis]|uniref:GFO/IDH/MocA-like oxidoreductase domain-containing protein n=1 Tax=Clavelina lepadiformis TaxID=159417 RepID=A0ABP0GFK6_CLALP